MLPVPMSERPRAFYVNDSRNSFPITAFRLRRAWGLRISVMVDHRGPPINGTAVKVELAPPEAGMERFPRPDPAMRQYLASEHTAAPDRCVIDGGAARSFFVAKPLTGASGKAAPAIICERRGFSAAGCMREFGFGLGTRMTGRRCPKALSQFGEGHA